MPTELSAPTLRRATTSGPLTLRSYARAHMYRVAHRRYGAYVELLGRALALPDDDVARFAAAAPLHDIGKLRVPSRILHKAGQLDAAELAEARRHVTYGHEIIGALTPQTGFDEATIAAASTIARDHHERWDGGGYPRGLRGSATPIEARIVGLADVYDALRSERAYKPAHDHDRAVDAILNGDGRTAPSHFDPALLAAFRGVHDQMRDVFERRSR